MPRLIYPQDIQSISSIQGIVKLFKKLGYDAEAKPLDIEDLELSSSLTDLIKEANLIASCQDNLLVLSLQFISSVTQKDSLFKYTLTRVIKGLSARPTSFIVLGTSDYRKIGIAIYYVYLDENFNSKVYSIISCFDCSQISYEVCNLLEALSIHGNSVDSLKSLFEKRSNFYGIVREYQVRESRKVIDNLTLYLRQIGRIPLLRADEEIELGRQINDLLYLERVRDRFIDRLEREPKYHEWAREVNMPLNAFLTRLTNGWNAKEKMVKSNLRLVVSIAKNYQYRDLDLLDLIQEGNLGLIRAAEKFDHTKGYKFSTYATWWIRQAITRAIADQSRIIRLPVHLYETISRIKKTTMLLSQERGRKPTEAEIATRMEMTIEKLRFIAKSAQLPISLETPIGKEEDSRLVDFIEFEGETPEDKVYQILLQEDLENVLGTLSPRERHVLRLRYGFDDGRMKTLEEIGQIFNVTRERIRQIEAKALKRLQHPNRNKVVKDYIL